METADGESNAARSTMTSLLRTQRVIVLAIALAALIFAVDVLTPFSFAIAVLYVLVLLVAANQLNGRIVLGIGGLCVALILIAFFARHDLGETGAVARALISLVAVVVATALILKNIRSTEALASQAALLDLTHDAIFTRSPDDVILSWNQGAEALYGWTEGEAIGRRSTELLGADSPEEWEAANGGLLANGRWEGQVRRHRRDGGQLVVLCRWSLERDPWGASRKVLETHSDVTERVEAELALERTREELAHSARLSTLGELTASIAHEINQPLAAISAGGDAALRWLRRAEPDLVEATDSIERMVGAARRASDIVGRLRALVRRAPTESAHLVMGDVVQEVLPLLQRELRAGGVRLQIEQGEEALVVRGDRVQLQQVVINLIINAIQAMSASEDRPRTLNIALAQGSGDDAGWVILTFVDSGPGLGGEDSERLFSPFFTTKPQGMGIGLSICRRIVEAHGGRITAAAAEPTGAVFIIRLPMAEEAAT